MKTQLAYLIILLVLTSIASGKYSGGTGELNDPYLIATPNDLNSIGLEPNDWDEHFKMIADINMVGITGTQFNIIGYYESSTDNQAFTGVFDGNNHTISNFTYNSTGTDRIGLFGYIRDANALIKGVGLIDPNIDAGTGGDVGSLVGRVVGNAIITCCDVEGGSVSGRSGVGGLVGLNGGNISNCTSTSNIEGFGYTGGLVGYNGGEISTCHSTGSVLCDYWKIGGLVGNNNGGTITNCTSSGSVVGDWYVGGLVGNNDDGTISRCYSSGNVNGNSDIGGLVGWNEGDSEIINCYATGSVLGTTSVGGLVALNNIGMVAKCYSSGSVTGDEDVGGLVGTKISGTITDSFWDVNSSGIDISDGGTPKMTAEMQKRSTFADTGWDMVNVWDIGEGQTYPFLRTHLPGDINKDDETNFYDLAIVAENWLKEE